MGNDEGKVTTIYDGCFKVFLERQQKVYIIVITFVSKLPEL